MIITPDVRLSIRFYHSDQILMRRFECCDLVVVEQNMVRRLVF